MGTTTSNPIPVMLDDGALQSLRSSVAGEVVLPGDAGYDDARRIWNAMIDRRPSVIVRCANAGDVQAAVNLAREQALLLSVRGGGHNVSGSAVCNQGVMIDLSPMKAIQIDPVALTARVEPGVLWEELDHATAAHGLATPGGTVAATGVAGLTLGGGQSWISGKYGLSLDNLLAAEVVLADGQIKRASASEHPDLFWALRGAGANFGVVTSFTFRLHPVTEVLGGMVVYPRENARDVLRFYREFAAAQPDELTTYAALLNTPDGTPVVALIACYTGDRNEGENVLAPLRGFGQPVADTIAPIPYVTMQGLLGPSFPNGRLNYWKSGMTAQISDHVIDAVIDSGGRMPSPHNAIAFIDVHGSAQRVPPTATAYYHRNLPLDVLILASWTDAGDSDANIRWTRELFAAIEPGLGDGVYVNELGSDDSDERVRRAYGANYARLSELKRIYDPGNLFHSNQNIQPAASTV